MNKKTLEQNQNLFELITVEKITFLKNLDKHIKINKFGEFKYLKIFRFDSDRIKNFLEILDKNSIYTLIPMISIHCRREDPHTILSQQILITRRSNYLVLDSYLWDQYTLFREQFGIEKLQYYNLIFKFKKIEIDFESYKNFK